jgi:hypothetical protein
VSLPEEIRLVNDQLRLLCRERNQQAPLPGSATVLIFPKPAVHRNGITSAEPHVHFVHPSDVEDLASAETVCPSGLLRARLRA